MRKSNPFIHGFILGAFISVVFMIMLTSIGATNSISKNEHNTAIVDTHSETGHAKQQSFIQISKNVMFWVFVTFLFLVFFLESYVWKPLIHFLDKRKESLIQEMEQSKIDREQSKHLLNENQKLQKESYQQAQNILLDAKKKSETIQQSIRLQAEEEAKLAMDKAQQSIQLAKKQSAEQIKNEIISISVRIASQLIGRNLDKDDHRRFVKENVNQLFSIR